MLSLSLKSQALMPDDLLYSDNAFCQYWQVHLKNWLEWCVSAIEIICLIHVWLMSSPDLCLTCKYMYYAPNMCLKTFWWKFKTIGFALRCQWFCKLCFHFKVIQPPIKTNQPFSDVRQTNLKRIFKDKRIEVFFKMLCTLAKTARLPLCK